MKIRIIIETDYTPGEWTAKACPNDLAQQWLNDYDLAVMLEEGTFTKVMAEEIKDVD